MKRILNSFWEKLRWHTNPILVRNLSLLQFFGIGITVIDHFGTPGDTLLTAIVCREIRARWKRIRINCVTPNPSLLELDPSIDVLNGPETFCTIRVEYLEIIDQKLAEGNVLRPVMTKLGITSYEYRARVYLSAEEQENAARLLAGLRRPFLSINAMSREKVKVWRLDYWKELLGELEKMGTVLQLGDGREPELTGVTRFAGKLSMRESMAILSHCSVHIGPDSFLMHAANGTGVPSVIIYGGSRPPGVLAYPGNASLFVQLPCSPCWIHDSHGGVCPYDMKCMDPITPSMVLEAVKEKIALVS
ncbi:MAG TPA: glycosyltransferase family 9 protein [Acidobacteriaceae bacterium]|jgi:ADP-heptose:LPS heptosyltransferase